MHPYVQLARQALEEYVKKGRKLVPPEVLPPEMGHKAGVFVCFKIKGELRGCIGTFVPTTENIYEEIVRNSVATASEDPRFLPVQEYELENISITIDVLSMPEKVTGISELDPKKYGVIVAKGHCRGLLLPDLEGVSTVEEQLRITKMKAGIDPADDNVDIFKFTVERYS